MTARYEVRGKVAVISMDNPPVNGLGLSTRVGIMEGLDRAADDPNVDAIVLTGAGKAFSGGADIREFGTPKAIQEPNLLTVIKACEDSPKPVIAAVHSVAMGGGLELALGCHYRVALPGAQIALPEVKLGLIPGAGGTQRLPRIIGVERAVNMIVKGDPVKSDLLANSGLFDKMIDGKSFDELIDGAVAFAGEVVAAGSKRPLVRNLKIDAATGSAFLGSVKLTVKAMTPNFPAAAKCVEAVEAAVLKPFEAGMLLEREIFMGLMMTPTCRAMRHAFLAERSCSKIPDVPDNTPTRPINKAAVIGAGTMGAGIAMNFANVGIPVTMLETKQEALDRGLATIRKNYDNTAKKGRLKPEQVETRCGLITGTLDYAAIGDADIVIEAVFEDIDVKKTVFEKLDEVMKPGAILASNTSTLDVDKIASFTKRPEDVIGTHFFSPANVMKLLEVVRGAKTAKDVLATVMALGKKIKKTAVVSGVCDGFIGNRMIEQYSRQALYLLEEGASPQQVDKAVEKWGMAMGPFRMSDLAGNDVGWYIRKRRRVERPNMQYPEVADRLCELGRFGQKTGAGWYDYVPGKRDALPSTVVTELIDKHRAAIGVTPRKISDDEIIHRLIYSLVNEACDILDEGIALRASDIDMVYLTGYGFPLHRGGPMCYADTVGLYNVARKMRQFAKNPHGDASFWTPRPRLQRLVEAGESFNG